MIGVVSQLDNLALSRRRAKSETGGSLNSKAQIANLPASRVRLIAAALRKGSKFFLVEPNSFFRGRPETKFRGRPKNLGLLG